MAGMSVQAQTRLTLPNGQVMIKIKVYGCIFIFLYQPKPSCLCLLAKPQLLFNGAVQVRHNRYGRLNVHCAKNKRCLFLAKATDQTEQVVFTGII